MAIPPEVSPAGPARPSWRARLLAPLLAQLTQGVSPRQLALALALGCVLGINPVPGTTTMLCVLAGVALRLNQPALQVGNFLTGPLQIALYVPFLRFGAWVFGAPQVGLAPQAILDAVRADPWGAASRYGVALLEAVAAWLIVAPPLVALLALALRPVLARWRRAPPAAPSETGEPLES